MSIVSKVLKMGTTIGGAVLGSKVAKENGLQQSHGITGGALLGYGAGAILIDGARAARNTTAMIVAVVKEIKEAEKTSQENALPEEEVVNEVIDSVE